MPAEVRVASCVAGSGPLAASARGSAKKIAKFEVPDDWSPDSSPEAALRYAMLGTVLFEPLILALRRMAHVARSRTLIGASRAARAEHKATTTRAQRATKRKKR